jgi:hypothetical protein
MVRRQILTAGLAACLTACLALGLLTGCRNTDATQLPLAQVEENVKKQFQLVEVSLAPSEAGYTGTGKDASGEGFELVVTKDPATRSLQYAGHGNRGTELTGSLRFQ